MTLATTAFVGVLVGVLGLVGYQAGWFDRLLGRKTEEKAEKKEEPKTIHICEAAEVHDGKAVKQAVQTMIEKGEDINARSKNGWTPLFAAAYVGQADTVRMLLDKGADMNVEVAGWPLLHAAARSGDVETIRLLIDKGLDVNTKNKDGKTPLYIVQTAKHPHKVEAIKLLIEKGADVNAKLTGGPWLNTPLHAAAYADYADHAQQAEAIRLLIEKGADVNARDKASQTPLHHAARLGKVQAVKMLLHKGADDSARNKDGKTPLDLANDGDAGHKECGECRAILEEAAKRRAHSAAPQSGLLPGSAPLNPLDEALNRYAERWQQPATNGDVNAKLPREPKPPQVIGK